MRQAQARIWKGGESTEGCTGQALNRKQARYD